MAHYLCQLCSAIMAANEPPERCESCETPAAEAFPHGPVVEDALAPVTGETPIAPVSTLELDDSDIVETSDARAVESEAPTAGPIARVSTLELDDGDLEEPEPPPPVPVLADAVFKPRPGRVAYPIPIDRDDDRQHKSVVEMDEMAAGKLPPVPPAPEVALPSQTRSLDATQKRQSWSGWIIGGVVAGVGLALIVGLGWPTEQEPTEPVAVAQSPDVRPAPEPDLTAPPPDLKRPDLQTAPDQAVVSQVPPSPDRPVSPDRPAPQADTTATPERKPVGDPLEEAQRLYKQGLRHLLRGQLDRAIATFRRALRRNPHLSLAYRGLGLAQLKKGNTAAAKAAFKRYLQLRPQAPDREAIRKRIEGL